MKTIENTFFYTILMFKILIIQCTILRCSHHLIKYNILFIEGNYN